MRNMLDVYNSIVSELHNIPYVKKKSYTYDKKKCKSCKYFPCGRSRKPTNIACDTYVKKKK